MFVALMGPIGVHIDRFDMDGDLKSRVRIVDHDLLGPHVALASDRQEHIIWVDSGTENIEMVDFNGETR